MTETRRRYELLFGLLLNSGLRISEALHLKASDVRLVAGMAKSVRVIGKGNKERLVPLPEAFGAVFGFWLKDRARGEFVFARAPGQKPVSAQAARAYLRGMLQKGGDRQEDQPAQAAPHLRHQPAQRRGRAGGHQGPAGPSRASPPPRFTPTSGRSGWSRWWQGCEQGRSPGRVSGSGALPS